MSTWLSTANELWLYAVGIALLVAAVEIGSFLGRRQNRRPEEGSRFLSTLAAPSIGLLALMIGFAFAVALSSFQARRAALLEEANAIGTTALRARMLSEPYNSAIAPLLKEYAHLRVVGAGFRPASQRGAAVLRRSTEIQDELWQQAMAAVKADPEFVPTGMFVEALNHMLDVHLIRLTAGRTSVPGAVFLMLEGIAVLSLGFLGFGIAQSGMRHRIATFFMAVMIASVITLILDLDRPRSGLITVSQQPLVDVIQGLQ